MLVIVPSWRMLPASEPTLAASATVGGAMPRIPFSSERRLYSEHVALPVIRITPISRSALASVQAVNRG